MAYFTKRTLQEYAARHINEQHTQKNLRRAMSSDDVVTVFLSHSHADIVAADKQDVAAARAILAAHGVDIYIDSEDAEMPRSTSALTAALLKRKIRSSDKFILLATTNARNSKWVPWELGFADEARRETNIAVYPIADDYGNWEGNEYMGLYNCILIGEGGRIGVFPSGSTSGPELSQWLVG